MKANALLLTLVLALGLAACGQEQQAEGPASGSAAPAVAPAAEPAAPAGAEIVADATAVVDAQGIYSARCAACHGKAGEGRGTNPKLVGLPVADIESRLKDYRAGKQMGPNTAIMAAASKSLSDEQIAAIAGFLGK